MFVKRDELAENFRREFFRENDIRRTIAFKNAMRHKRIRRAFSFDFFGGFAKSESLGLGKDIRQQNVVVPTQRSEGVAKRDKITWDNPRALYMANCNSLSFWPLDFESMAAQSAFS